MALPKLLQKLFQSEGAGPKLREDIIPIDSALSATSTNGVQNKVISSALDEKLSLSGGTMTGTILFNNSIAKILKADKNGSLAISGGNVDSDGGAGSAILWLGGGNDSSAFGKPGIFSLQASKGTFGQSDFLFSNLVGTPDGSLTWNGRPVLTGKADWANRTNLTIGQSFTAPSRGFVYASGASSGSWGAIRILVNGITIVGSSGLNSATGGTAYVNAGDTVLASKEGTVEGISTIFVPIQ